MKSIIPYHPNLRLKAKKLRNNSTRTEIILWKRLKNKQLSVVFNRQKPIGNYIVDFYCAKHKLAIEIDGASHELKGNYDEKRQEFINKLGVYILRFTNKEVISNTDSVISTIRRYIEKL